MNTWIIALGGSIVAPDGVDIDFIGDVHTLLTEYIEHKDYRFVLIIGGGAPARIYQQAYRDFVRMHNEEHTTQEHIEAQDRIGIKATHLNAEFVKEIFGDYAEEYIVTNPEDQEIEFVRPVLVGAGWKPGFSTDLDAVMLARRFNAEKIINLTNVSQIHTADPRSNSNAQALEDITWAELIDMVGDTWNPGMKVPFDPIACKLAQTEDIQVISAFGRDLDNLRHILDNKPFVGTLVHN